VRLATQPAVAHAQSYAGQPSAEKIGTSKRIEGQPGHEDGFLDAVFCSPIVSQDSLAEAQRHRPMLNNQLSEGDAVPLSSAVDKSGGDAIVASVHQLRRVVATAQPLGYLDLCYPKRGGSPGSSPLSEACPLARLTK
jgi:hypothetical protein